jgi:hypothetical protein
MGWSGQQKRGEEKDSHDDVSCGGTCALSLVVDWSLKWFFRVFLGTAAALLSVVSLVADVVVLMGSDATLLNDVVALCCCDMWRRNIIIMVRRGISKEFYFDWLIAQQTDEQLTLVPIRPCSRKRRHHGLQSSSPTTNFFFEPLSTTQKAGVVEQGAEDSCIITSTHSKASKWLL